MADEPSRIERRALTVVDAGQLVERAAAGTASGLPLDEIFLALAEDADSPQLRSVASRIAGELSRGANMATALESVTDSLPAYLQRTLAASSDTGQTAAILAGLARHESARRRLRIQMRSVLFYPAIVFALLVAVVAGLTIFVVPQFESIYRDFDLELPEMTMFLLSSARAVPWALGGLAAAAVLVAAALLFPATARIVHWLRTGVPLVGRLWIWNGQHEFASILGALVGQHITLDEALGCTAASLRDQNLARSVRRAADKCAGGALLSQSLAESIHFDPALPALVAWGEAQSTLPESLRQAAKTFEEELDLQAAFLQRVMPSVLFIGVITILYFFVIALMVPLVDLINNLSG